MAGKFWKDEPKICRLCKDDRGTLNHLKNAANLTKNKETRHFFSGLWLLKEPQIP